MPTSSLFVLNPQTSAPFSLKEAPAGATTAIGDNQIALARTTGGTVTVQLPAPASLVVGQCFGVVDEDRNAATNNITVSGNGTNIDGAATYTQQSAGAACAYVYDGNQFRRVAVRRKFIGSPEVLELNEDSGGLSSGAAVIAITESRETALDINHIHAWEMDEAAGAASFADTGLGAGTKVPLVIVTPASTRLATQGLFGRCPYFNMSALGIAALGGYADAPVPSFNDLPNQTAAAGQVSTTEIWARRCGQNTNTQFPFSASRTGAANMSVGVAGSLSAVAYSYPVFAAVWTLGGANGQSDPVAFSAESQHGHWQHIALTDNGAAMELYVNGELVFQDLTAAGGIAFNNGANPRIRVGALGAAGSDEWVGQLSRFRISNIVRSQAYFREVYRKGMLQNAA